jgi:hypothetical protein
MKKVLVVLFAGLMVLGVSNVLMAATDTSAVTVRINAIDSLVVGDGGTIILDQINGNNLTSLTNGTATLSYTHNNTNPGQITAEVLPGNIPAGIQDITLTAAVTGGAGAQTLVAAGSANGAHIVRSGIAAGALNTNVTYVASATVSGTRSGDYLFTVTFTSTNP